MRRGALGGGSEHLKKPLTVAGKRGLGYRNPGKIKIVNVDIGMDDR